MIVRKRNTISNDADYQKSNSIETVDKKKFNSKVMSDMLKADDTIKGRQKAAQAMVSHLSKLYKINSPKVVVTEKPRRANDRGQTYGFYRHNGNPAGDTIVIYNTTAKTNKVISIKSFTDTLLHEFTHHYDTRYLKIKSAHTAGFYKRISDLKRHLTKATIPTKDMRSDITTMPLRKLITVDITKSNVGG